MPSPREQVIVDDKGRKTKVVLPIKHYEKLLEHLYRVRVGGSRGSHSRPGRPLNLMPLGGATSENYDTRRCLQAPMAIPAMVDHI
jgi:hypothetical protein